MATQGGLHFLGTWRFKLLDYLVVRPMTPTELASLEKKHLSQVSRTLGELRREGLVEYTYSGSREKYYKLTKEGYMIYARMSRQVG
jgi:DNA-binding transcriptional regulator GbsR (MarR family)